VKNPENYINYKLTSFEVNKAVNFPIEINVEEVIKLSKKEKKKYKRIAKSFLMTILAFPTLTSKSMAATFITTPSQNTMGLLIPPDF